MLYKNIFHMFHTLQIKAVLQSYIFSTFRVIKIDVDGPCLYTQCTWIRNQARILKGQQLDTGPAILYNIQSQRVVGPIVKNMFHESITTSISLTRKSIWLDRVQLICYLSQLNRIKHAYVQQKQLFQFPNPPLAKCSLGVNKVQIRHKVLIFLSLKTA